MRLVNYATAEGARAGLLRDGRVLVVSDAPAGDLQALLSAGSLEHARAAEGEGVAIEDVELLPPIERPGKILCIGLNYRAHAEEQGVEPPETPTFFAKFATSL